MQRREFIANSAMSMGALMAAGCATVKKTQPNVPAGAFDIHPFVKAHPEAVFIRVTSVESKTDYKAIHDEAFRLADELIVKTDTGGFPNSTRITCKPNWTCNSPVNGKTAEEFLGVNTDMNFIEGFLQSMKKKGPQECFIRECACPADWAAHGWPQMAQANNFDFRDLTTKDYWQLKKDDLIFKKVDGVVFKEIGFMTPMTAPDTFLVNIAKFKAHGMGLTASIKNLQGISGKRFHQFCGGNTSIFNSYDKRYHKFFQPDYMSRVAELRNKHVKDGIPRWDKDNAGDGFYMEQWVQRMLDSFSVTPTNLNMVEGIYGQDGNGFQSGSHDGKPMTFMSNNIIFGLDAFRVDIITHWLGGHEPGNFGLFHIGIERGLSSVLDPFDIPIYLWDDGKAVLVKLDYFKRTPLVTYYMTRDYKGQTEPYYHLCDEPFDYTSWKLSRNKATACAPNVRPLGSDSTGKIVMEVSNPKDGDVYVEILNNRGDVVWRLKADGLPQGKHQVVWDGFSSPGLHNVYVRGMGWDAERQMVIYS